MTYTPPLHDMRLALEHAAGLQFDMTDAVLEEAAKLSSQVWAPLNAVGDKQMCKIAESRVTTPPGFKEAYKQFASGGWNAVIFNPDHGGQGLPWALGMAVSEMFQSANLGLSLCPLLTAAAIEAIEKHGTDAQKHAYLPKLISGEWTGTMQLTEPQAGTDLAAIRSVAKKNGDHYLLRGQKIFITYGEQDFTDNIIHLVLARIDGLPEGNDGLGLFIVPKFLADGKRNAVHALSIEHKLGIHGSPTCVMAHENAVAYLVGDEGKGLRNMFTMMNNARISVGLQGVALAERAYQHALSYAKDRVQGFKGDKRVPIIEHADVKRMLMTMKSTTEAARALAYYAGGMIDRARAGDKDAASRVDLLTPLVKAWSTDLAVENASLGVQIHGGMGFIEETGAAQYYRDARILPIYEGTNGVQAADLVFRKVLRDGGDEAKKFIAEMKSFPALHAAIAVLEEATTWILSKPNADALAVGSTSYLRMFATIAGGYMLLKLDAVEKRETAQFYLEAILPQVHGLKAAAMGGGAAHLSLS